MVSVSGSKLLGIMTTSSSCNVSLVSFDEAVQQASKYIGAKRFAQASLKVGFHYA